MCLSIRVGAAPDRKITPGPGRGGECMALSVNVRRLPTPPGSCRGQTCSTLRIENGPLRWLVGVDLCAARRSQAEGRPFGAVLCSRALFNPSGDFPALRSGRKILRAAEHCSSTINLFQSEHVAARNNRWGDISTSRSMVSAMLTPPAQPHLSIGRRLQLPVISDLILLSER